MFSDGDLLQPGKFPSEVELNKTYAFLSGRFRPCLLDSHEIQRGLFV